MNKLLIAPFALLLALMTTPIAPTAARAEDEIKNEFPAIISETPAEAEEPSANTPKKRDLRVPLYTTLRPEFGFQATGSLKAFGAKDINPGQGGKPARAVALQLEYQPRFIQAIGVLGAGLSANLFPIASDAGLTPNVTSIWAGGAQIRYQARFFHEQILVPVGGYEVEYLSYRYVSLVKGRVLTQGPFFGGYLLLNMFEPTTAAEAFGNNGVKRSYAVVEFRNLKGSNADITIAGSSLYFGVRIEY